MGVFKDPIPIPNKDPVKQPNRIARGLGGLVIERRKSQAGSVGLQRIPIEIKKPNISDIKKKQ